MPGATSSWYQAPPRELSIPNLWTLTIDHHENNFHGISVNARTFDWILLVQTYGWQLIEAWTCICTRPSPPTTNPKSTKMTIPYKWTRLLSPLQRCSLLGFPPNWPHAASEWTVCQIKTVPPEKKLVMLRRVLNWIESDKPTRIAAVLSANTQLLISK